MSVARREDNRNREGDNVAELTAHQLHELKVVWDGDVKARPKIHPLPLRTRLQVLEESTEDAQAEHGRPNGARAPDELARQVACFSYEALESILLSSHYPGVLHELYRRLQGELRSSRKPPGEHTLMLLRVTYIDLPTRPPA